MMQCQIKIQEKETRKAEMKEGNVMKGYNLRCALKKLR